jgi:hypothetical protein
MVGFRNRAGSLMQFIVPVAPIGFVAGRAKAGRKPEHNAE